MKVTIKYLGTQFLYPYGDKGPYHILRRYRVEAEDGRIDAIEEMDEDLMPEGVYDFSKETVDGMFGGSI